MVCKRLTPSVSSAAAHRDVPHSTELCGGAWHRSSKAARGEDLQIKHPVCGGYASAFHFHATLTGMLGAPLIRNGVVQVGEPREKCPLTPAWVVKPPDSTGFSGKISTS